MMEKVGIGAAVETTAAMKIAITWRKKTGGVGQMEMSV